MTPEPNDPTRAGAGFADAPPQLRLSRNEIETLCAKAARGAGMAWGCAEEAGVAAGWLQARGIDGAAALLAHLIRTDGQPWAELRPDPAPADWRPAGQGPICPVALGAALQDFRDLPEADMTGDGLAAGPVAQPVLVLPFLAALAADRRCTLALAWTGGTVQVTPDGTLAGDVAALAALDVTSFRIATGTPGRTWRADPLGCDSATLAALDALALRTTVPPSDASRADAGAAGGDND